MNIVDIKILDDRIGTKFPSLTYSTDGSSGLDLRACIKKKIISVCSNQVILIPTGIAIFIKDPLITAFILPRSGLGHYHGIVLGNTIGVIDSDYQGELMLSVWNRSKKTFYISCGDRVAQMIFVPIIKPDFNIVSDFKNTNRNIHGFGSSGIK
ncbi:dUTP diphosphatase [Buchnera aphidicola (Stegophylla sp.)]|uniref:Deoxyuridine 5'-triphosphate nucleotidohydrolase n=2 Tax=Buchnera aphidicola TaxID=9 RepID=A0A4D6YKT5_9GAMM|nr:dUTP diphosphatase [Buchnera aphidicola (Stegophylla sp.)]